MKKILIIEDDTLLRESLQKKLMLEGYQTLTAVDGEVGLEKIKESKPDLILLDIVMPKIDGTEVLKQIKTDKDFKNIPVIMISNSGQPVETQKMLELGAFDYLVKANFDPDEVLEKVKKALSEQKPARPKILIIEDDQFLKDLLERKLIQAGYQVLSTNDGEEGLKITLEEKPALVLLDILLPSMSGWEILEKMKNNAETSKIPILLLTNLGEKEDVEKGLKMGASDYIIKAHFTPNEIIQKIEKYLSRLPVSDTL
ncbi:MAG: response regulator [bacterium]